MLVRRNGALGKPLAGAHGGKTSGVLVVPLVVSALLVELEKAVKFDNRAGRPELEPAGADLRGNIGSGALQLRRFHLAGNSSDPDQFIELRLVWLHIAGNITRTPAQVRWPNGLMGFLCVLGLGLVAARRGRTIRRPILFEDDITGRGDRFLVDLYPVGPHVGDQADRLAANVCPLVKALR